MNIRKPPDDRSEFGAERMLAPKKLIPDLPKYSDKWIRD